MNWKEAWYGIKEVVWGSDVNIYAEQEPERRVDLLELRKSLNRLVTFSKIFIVIMVVQSTFFIVHSSKDRSVIERIVQFKDGEITQQVELLRQEREHFTITREELDKIKTERYYNTYAASICDFLSDEGVVVKFSNVKTTLIAVNEIVPKWFPNQEFTEEEINALIKVETNFVTTCVGTKGERGLGQILRWREVLKAIGKPKASAFDIYTNIEMTCYMLKQKYLEYDNDKKSALIAYNGYRIDKDGKVIEDYWHKLIASKQTMKRLKEHAKRI